MIVSVRSFQEGAPRTATATAVRSKGPAGEPSCLKQTSLRCPARRYRARWRRRRRTDSESEGEPVVLEVLVCRRSPRGRRTRYPEVRVPAMRRRARSGCRTASSSVRPARRDRSQRGIPEGAQHLHTTAVVPRARCNDPARPGHSAHLAESRVGVGQEVEDGLRHHQVEGVVVPRQFGRGSQTYVGGRQPLGTGRHDGSEGSAAARPTGAVRVESTSVSASRPASDIQRPIV